MLTFINFQKKYQDNTVLNIPDFNVDPGIYWLKGGNGTGKSTLLKSLAGLIHFDGDILLNKQINLKKNPRSYRRLVNFAEAEPVFPEFLTGNELVTMFADAKEAESGQQNQYLESMDMLAYIDQPIGTYSSGMLKKLSLTLAFLGKPQLILLDEPLITVDTASLEILYKWITAHYKHYGTNFILASHQPLENSGIPVTREILIETKSLKFI
ncbi:ABC transporter ATP-binding protein [Pedobacter sp.]|jgi:ABC-2 type transport system ATP-binding protein|uniref:ABC transporter ATP-binding protein n=1 Tax=Pedobacter sp. TaxID=1411316 RepID=UPI002C6696AF|nr:ABC transporter ATP-binding protein [Pedobacter sp.]HWW42031.1 ABC transporter ATP-binding protein [Pedobacter sp.]